MQVTREALTAVTLAAQTILECSGEIYRAEDTALRLCHAFGFEEADILCFPTGFTLTAVLPGGETVSRTQRVRDRSIQLSRLDEVNRISRAVAQGQMDAPQALAALQALRTAQPPGRARMILAYAASAAFFAVMFGGGIKEFALALCCGALMQAVLPLLQRWQAPAPLSAMAGGMLAAGSALLMLQLFGGNQEALISGAIMPLLPGLALTNAVRDTMRGDLIAGMARSTEALMSATMLAAGVAVVLML